MGLFEQYPILLVVLIVVVVEGWSALKAIVRRLYDHRATVRSDHPAVNHDD